MKKKVTPESLLEFLIQKLEEEDLMIGEDEIINFFGESTSPEISNFIDKLAQKKRYVSQAKIDEFFGNFFDRSLQEKPL